MKVTLTTGGEGAIKVAELSLENVGINRFRASIPLQDGAGKVISRTAEIEAASERTKAGTVRVMLKCTIPYYPQTTDEDGHVIVDSTKSSKAYTLHIVHTIPSVMATEALNSTLARQAAQLASLASQIIGIGLIPSAVTTDIDTDGMLHAPLQTGSPSVDGVASYPLTDSEKSGTGWIGTVHNVSSAALAGSFLGRALAGLMPIDINTDKTCQLQAVLLEQ